MIDICGDEQMRQKLPELCNIQYGYAFDSAGFTEDSSYPPLVRIRDVKRGYSETYFVGEYPEEYVLHAGDLLVGMDGEFNIARWKSRDALLNQRVCKITAKEGTNEEYLRFALSKALKEIENRTAFVTVKHLSAKELNKLELQVPNLVEQSRAANILSKIEQIISLRSMEIQRLDEFIKARFVEMFGDPASNPMGWPETTLGKECYYIKDGPHKSLPDIGQENGGHPFISVRNIVNHVIDFSTAKYISDEDYAEARKKCCPEKGDMLYSKGGTTGIAKLIDVDIEFVNWVHLAVLKFDHSLINGVFFENMLNCDYCYDQSQRLTKGIANRDLVLSAMAQIKMYRPPVVLQQQFATFVSQVDKSKLIIMPSGIQLVDEIRQLFDSPTHDNFDEDNAYLDINYTIRE